VLLDNLWFHLAGEGWLLQDGSSFRRGVSCYFVIMDKKQLKNILAEYIYCNSYRPHQGIEQCIPDEKGFFTAWFKTRGV